MKILWLLSFIYALVLASQSQIVVGSYSNATNAMEAQEKLNALIKKDVELQDFFTKHSLTTKYKVHGKYFSIIVEPFKDLKTQEEALKKLKPKFKGAYVLKLATKRIEQEKSSQNIIVKNPLPEDSIIKKTIVQNPIVKDEITEKPASLENGNDTSKENQKLSYNNAKLLFEKKEYQKAYDAFYKLFETNLEDPNINFYLGRSAYMLQDFEHAIAAYERVLNIDPESFRSKLEIAKCYFELKEYKTAQTIFLETIKENMPPNVKQNIEMYLTAINSKIQKNFFNGSAVLGVNYDTNIYNRSSNDIYNGVINPFTSQLIDVNNTTPDKSGYAHQEVLSLNHMYSISDDMKFKNEFLVYTKFDISNHNNDIGFIQYSPALSVVYDGKTLVDYALLFNKIWLGSKPYMTLHGIYPKLKYMYSPSIILGTSFKYQQKSIDTVTSQLKAAEFTLRNIYSDSLMFLLYSQLYTEKKISGSLTNIDYDMVNLSFTTSYRYTPKLIITPKLQWYTKLFKEQHPNFPKTQKDNEYEFSLNTTYSYGDNILFNLEYANIHHISNIPSWEFNKQSVTANVILLF